MPEVDIHAIVQFPAPPSIKQLTAAASAGLTDAGIPFVSCTGWNGNSESIPGYRVNMVFVAPGPTLPEAQAAIKNGLTLAGMNFTSVSVYHHPLPAK
jgi:hypothetical protein